MEISATMMWAILGLGLLLVEVLTGTFTFVFFAIGALVVALVKKLFHLDQLPAEIFIFSFLSTVQVIFFRKKLLAAFHKNSTPLLLKDRNLLVSHDVPARGYASVEYQGTVWTAYNDTDVDMVRGQTVLIERVDGVKLVLKSLH